MGYLTPSFLPTDTICRVLTIPNGDQYLANVLGCLQTLTFDYSYSQFGLLTPLESAQAMIPMFDAICFNQGVCRVIGEVICYAGATSPNPNWLECDGSSLLRSDYPDLFGVIGVIYGSVDGSHFNLPNLADIVVAGKGAYSIGTSFGEPAHTLTLPEIPSHAHGYLSSVPTVINGGLEAPATASTSSVSITDSVGGGGSHSNYQPTLSMNYLIVAKDG